MAHIVMACIVMAYIVMACIVVAQIVPAYIVMVCNMSAAIAPHVADMRSHTQIALQADSAGQQNLLRHRSGSDLHATK